MSYLPGKAYVRVGGVWTPVGDGADASVPVNDDGGSLTVDGSVTADTELPAAAALADLVANPTVPGVGGFLMVWNGASWDRLVGRSTASSGAILRNAGDIEHDAVNSQVVQQVGGHARAVDDPPAVVSAAGDRVRFWADRFGAQVVRRRKIRESYTAVFRLGEAAARLDQTFTHVANTNKQWATLHHLATATKELTLNKVVVFVTSNATVAPQGIIELRELTPGTTAPATGNPAITGRPHRVGTGAHEATALYLPTTQGSEAAVNSPLAHMVYDDAVSVATAAFQHPQDGSNGGLTLFDAALLDDQVMAPTVPVGVAGGWAVVCRWVGATVTRLTVLMVFTEEIP